MWMYSTWEFRGAARGAGTVTGFHELRAGWKPGGFGAEEGLTGVQERACAPARRRGSVAAAETSFG